MRQRHFCVTSCSPPAVGLGCHMLGYAQASLPLLNRSFDDPRNGRGRKNVLYDTVQFRFSDRFVVKIETRRLFAKIWICVFFLMSRCGFLFAYCCFFDRMNGLPAGVAALKMFRSSLFCLQCSRPHATSVACTESQSDTKRSTLYFSTERLQSVTEHLPVRSLFIFPFILVTKTLWNWSNFRIFSLTIVIIAPSCFLVLDFWGCGCHSIFY